MNPAASRPIHRGSLALLSCWCLGAAPSARSVTPVYENSWHSMAVGTFGVAWIDTTGNAFSIRRSPGGNTTPALFWNTAAVLRILGADLDGDNQDELIWVTWGSQLYIHNFASDTTRGPVSFPAEATHGPGSSTGYDISAGRFGPSDPFATLVLANNRLWRYNYAANTFSTLGSAALRFVQRGNFDPNNAVDEFMVNDTTNSAKVFYAGSTTFGIHQGNTFYGVSANLNASGREEFFCLGANQNSVYYFPDFGIDNLPVFTGGTAVTTQPCLGAGDFDGNGVDEGYALGAGGSGGTTRVFWKYTLAGGWVAGFTQTPTMPNNSWQWFILGDRDGDGKDEAYLVSQFDQTRLFKYAHGTPVPVEVVTQPALASFEAWPPSVGVGEASTLVWAVSNATSVVLNGGVFNNQDVTGLTSTGTGSLSSNTVYTLTAYNGTAQVSRQITVGVGVTPLPPRLNEAMASNLGVLKDERGFDSDWLELRNPNPFGYDLSLCYLTDSANPREWRLPAQFQIPGDGHLRIWCSGRGDASNRAHLHAGFSLNAAGETLRLVAANGSTVLDTLALPRALENISYGIPAGGGPPAHLATATPAAANGAPYGPTLFDLTRDPAPAPEATDPLVVTVAVFTNAAPVSTVTLHYRRMFESEVALPMNDAGADGDAAAGDGVHSATIPASLAAPGEAIRWRVVAGDAGGRAARAPTFVLPEDSPEYYGTVTRDAGAVSALRILQQFIQTPSQADTDSGARGMIYWAGEFFDNVGIRLRGETSRAYPKKSYKFDFHDGYHLRLAPGVPRVDEVNLNTTYTDKSYVRALIASEFSRSVGVPAPQVEPVQVRLNGVFRSLSLLTEQTDSDLLSRWALDRQGALYKGGTNARMDGVSAYEKKTRTWESNADLNQFIGGLLANNTHGPALDAYLFDQVEVPALVNHMATIAVMQNIDASDRNHFAHQDKLTIGAWRLLPQDLDLTFGPDNLNTDAIVHDPALPSALNRPNASHPFIGSLSNPIVPTAYNHLLDRIVRSPRTRGMLLRRIRTLVDSHLAAGYFQARIDHWVPLLQDDVNFDHALWGSDAHFPGNTYTLMEATNRIKNEYLAPRLGYFINPATAWTTPQGGTEGLPSAPPPNPSIAFGATDAGPASGDQDHEFVELVNPNAFSVDVSGWRMEGGATFTLPPGAVIPAGESLYLSPNPRAFRQRLVSPTGGQGRFVLGPYSGYLSNQGETLRLRDASSNEVATVVIPPAPTLVQQNLVIAEMMYHPVAGGALAEFLEVLNISPVLTLDLTGVAFTNGVSFSFTGSPQALLGPGARALVVRDVAAFTSVHGPGLPVAGVYTGALDNSGERVRLVDALGNTVADFVYDDVFPWPEAGGGGGASLVLVRPHTRPDPALPSSWRASTLPGGNPGGSDAQTFGGVADADADGNGERDLIDHAFGNNPARGRARLTPGLITNGVPAKVYFSVWYRRNLAADDVAVTPQLSPDLSPWTTVPNGIVWIGEAYLGDGTSRMTFRSADPVDLLPGARVRVEAVPAP